MHLILFLSRMVHSRKYQHKPNNETKWLDITYRFKTIFHFIWVCNLFSLSSRITVHDSWNNNKRLNTGGMI